MEIEQVKTDRRIPELDFLRGCALILMMFHHTLGDLYDFYHVQAVAFQHDYWFYYIGRPLVLIVFLAVSGISCRCSRNSMRRGIRMVIFSIAATALSIFVDGMAGTGLLLFNVIHVVAFSTVAYALIEKLAQKAGWIPGPGAMERPDQDYQPHLFAGFLIILGVLGVFTASMIDPILPAMSKNPLLIVLGSAAQGVHQLDQMPLFPWIGFFLVGGALGQTLYAPGLPLTPTEGRFYRWARPIRFLGRHSLWVYFAHQPIILFILWLLNKVGVFA